MGQASNYPEIIEPQLKAAINQIKDGDMQAFAIVYDLYYQRITNYIYARVLNPDISQDIVSNVFFKALEAIPKFKWKNKESFNGWIYRIATNEINLYFRKNNRYKFVPQESLETFFEDTSTELPHEELEQKLTQNSQYMIIQTAIRQLKPIYQTLLHLHYFEELSHKEISYTLKKNESTTRVYLHRAIKALTKILQQDGNLELAKSLI